MSAVKALFPILLWQMSLLHNEAALVVFAPSSHKAQLGKNFVLPCSFKVDDPSINLQFLAILWLFQGNEVLRIDNKGTTSQPRMLINQQGLTKGNANMEIRNVTISDIGKYRCMVIYSPQKEFKDIDLNVYAIPSVTIEKVEKEDQSSVALCSVTGFYPRDIKVEILQDRTIMEDSVLSAYHTNEDRTYSVNKTWKIPTDVSPQMLSCSVLHETLSSPVQKDLQLAYQVQRNDNGTNVGVIAGCIIGVTILLALIGAVYYYKSKAGSQKFSMGDIESPVWIDGVKTALSCKASNCTGDAKVTWVIQSKDGTRLEVTENPSKDKEEEEPLMSGEYEVTRNIVSHKKGKLQDETTKLTFIPSISRHLGTTVTCKIYNNKEVMEKIYDPKSILAKPKFNEPVKSTLSPQGEVELSATLQRFYPEKMNISWTSKSAKSEIKIQSKENISNNGHLFDLESKCSVPGELFKDPKFKVMVTWKHESMEGPEFRELSVRDLPWHPKLQATPIESVFQGDEVLLQCRVSDYFPDALVAKWFERKTGSQEVEISSSEKYKIPEISSYRTENQTFSSTAVLSYKRSDLSEKGIEFTCRVEHPSLGTPLQSTILQYKDTAEMPTFSINNIYGPQTWHNGEKVTLYCGASYCTENTQAIWRVTEEGGTRYDILETPSGEEAKSGLQYSGYVAHRERTEKSEKEDHLDFTSSLTFTPSISKHQNVTITCRIVDSGEKFKEKTFHYKNLFAKPTVSSPIKLSLTDSEEVLCSLDIEKCYPNNIQIKWNDKETSDRGKILQNDDGTYTINSQFKVSGSFFSLPNSAVKVSWKHDSMEDWESRELSVLDKEFPWRPEVWDIPVPNLFYGNTATLKCEVSNVFPKVLSVKWLKKEKASEQVFPLSQNDGYNISELTPQRQKDNTFTYKACLKFKPSIADKGEEFICRVEHPSLKEPAEKSTGPLTIEDVVIPPSEKQDTPLHRAQDVSVTDSAVILPPTADQLRFIVGKIQGSPRWIHGEKVALYISVSYCSEDSQVMWMVEQTDGKVEEISSNGGDPRTDSDYMISKDSEESDKEGLFNISSSLTFVSSVSRHRQVTIACKITSDGQTKTMKFQPQSIYAKPQALEPVKTSLCDNGDVLCSLSLQKFYPRDVELSWRSGEDQLESKEEYEENNDGTFNGNSHCTVPGKLLLDPKFTLHVTWNHKSLDGQQSQVLSWREPGLSWCPVIEEVPIPHVLTERQNTLRYNISGYFPDEVTVIWYRKEKGAQEYVPLSQDKRYQIPDIQSQRQSDLTYSCKARLLFIPTVTDGESEIMCKVSHPSLERPIERGSGPLQVQAKPRIRKSLKPSLGIGKVTFCQPLENFYPKHIQIEWHYWSGEKLRQRCSSQEKFTPKLDKTVSVVSECGVSEDLLQSPNFRVRVSWMHESMDEEENREFSIKDKDFPWRPQVEMSVPPLRIGEEATIQCTVTKYFPEAVNVLWFRKDEQSREMYPVSSDGMYRITNIPLERQNDKLYGGRSCLTFYPSLERDQGVEYICRVKHPSLEKPIETSTGALQVTEPEQQNQLPQYEDNQAYQKQLPQYEDNQAYQNQLSQYEDNQAYQNQYPQYEDNQAYQNHRSATTMVIRFENDCEMASDSEETSLDTSGATYVKNKQKPHSKLYGPRHAMYDEKDQEKKRRNPETKKHASDKTMHKLQNSSKDEV